MNRKAVLSFRGIVRCVVVAFLLMPAAGYAAPVTIELTDDEQAAFKQVLDAATRAGDTAQARVTVYFLNKMQMAGETQRRAAEEKPKPAPKE